jgi:hypothetical protein
MGLIYWFFLFIVDRSSYFVSAWLLIFLAFYLFSSTFLPSAGPADLLWAGKGVPEARPGGLLGRQDQRARCQAFPSLMSYVVTRYLSFGYSLPHGEKKLDQSERQILSLAVSLVLFISPRNYGF